MIFPAEFGIFRLPFVKSGGFSGFFRCFTSYEAGVSHMAVADVKSSRRNVRARRQRTLASAIGVVIERLEERRLLTLANGGFELPNVGYGNYQAAPADAAWDFSNAGIAGSGAQEMGYAAAPVGSQAAVLSSGGAISQSCDFGSAGLYYLRLEAGGGSGRCQVSIDGGTVASFTVNSAEL